jgi:hypothetical protein
MCDFNKEQDTNIYHFTNEIINNTKNIQNPITLSKIFYENFNNTDQVDRIFNNSIKICDQKNILIIVNSIIFPNICNLINNYIDNEIKNKYTNLHNITIINFTNNNLKTLFYTQIFKKIINVFSQKGEYYINDKDFFLTASLNKNFQKEIDIEKKELFKFVSHGGSSKEILVRIMNTNNISDNLTDQWWFKWYFNIPPCADIRLSQSTGTCWLNSAINSLFLIENIVNFIKNKYETLSLEDKENYKIPLKNFSINDDTKKLVYSMIYHLVINKTKAHPKDKNFISYLATQIKCIYNNKKSKKMCENINYGNGGDSYFAVKIIFSYILNKSDYFCIDISSLLYDEYNKLIKKYNKISNKINKIYDEYNNKKKSKDQNIEKINSLYDEYNFLNKKSENLEKKINILDKSIEKKIKNFKIEDVSYLKIKNEYIPNILVIRGNFISLNKEIVFQTVKYILASAVISLKIKNIEHAVSGIICNNKAYIYDSNNILVKCDWYKGEKELKIYFNDDITIETYKSNINFLDISCAIYVKI